MVGMYTPGQVIATRGRQRLVYDTTVDGVEFGHIEDERGVHPQHTLVAILARGYWKPPAGA